MEPASHETLQHQCAESSPRRASLPLPKHFPTYPDFKPCRNYHSYRYNEAAKIAGLGSRMCKFVRDVEKHPKDDGDQAWQHRESARFSHQSASPETGIGTGAGNLEVKLGIRHAVLAQPDLLACKCATGAQTQQPGSLPMWHSLEEDGSSRFCFHFMSATWHCQAAPQIQPPHR